GRSRGDPVRARAHGARAPRAPRRHPIAAVARALDAGGARPLPPPHRLEPPAAARSLGARLGTARRPGAPAARRPRRLRRRPRPPGARRSGVPRSARAGHEDALLLAALDAAGAAAERARLPAPRPRAWEVWPPLDEALVDDDGRRVEAVVAVVPDDAPAPPPP